MSLEQCYIALAVGVVISLACSELIGINVGIVCPGYFAMALSDPLSICSIIIVSLLVYLVVTFILPKIMIIYGQRRFACVLLLTLFFKILLEVLLPGLSASSITYQNIIGVASTGVLANNSIRQGFVFTVPACLLATGLTYGIVQMISLVGGAL